MVDWSMVERLGLSTFLTVSIAGGAFWLIRTVISMGEKHLLNYQAQFMKLLDEHGNEREKWMQHYEKLTQTFETAARYNREEHLKIMTMIESKIGG